MCFNFVNVGTHARLFFCTGGSCQSSAGLQHVPVFSNEEEGHAGLSLLLSEPSAGGHLTPNLDSPGQVGSPQGSSMLSRLPRRMRVRILQLEFIEMSELLPEAWSAAESQETSSSMFKLPSRRSPVSDLGVWMECYALMASVLVERYPSKASHFFAYLRRISRAARNFQGSAWVAYDRMYRRQALARGSLDWGVEDPGLYSEAFVGRAKVVPRCSHRLSEFHAVEVCPDLPRLAMGYPLQATQTSVFAHSSNTEICKRYNEERCNYKKCRFRHVCSGCKKGNHPSTRCPEGKSTNSRVRSPRREGR